jgi:hypothetical protein
MTPKYKTLLVLASAMRAYQANGRVNRDFVRENGAEFQPNRLIIINALNQNQFSENEITEAQKLVAYLKDTVLMQTLKKGSANQFLKNVVELLDLEYLTARDFGLIAWAPKLTNDYKKKDHSKEISALYENNSKHFGKINDRVEIDFTLIDNAYIKNYNCYCVYGYTQHGNLVSYWTGNSEKIIQQGNIRGRINKHVTDSHRGDALVTILNYVKVIKK